MNTDIIKIMNSLAYCVVLKLPWLSVASLTIVHTYYNAWHGRSALYTSVRFLWHLSTSRLSSLG